MICRLFGLNTLFAYGECSLSLSLPPEGGGGTLRFVSHLFTGFRCFIHVAGISKGW